MCVALSQRGPAPQGRAHLMVAGDHIATAGVKGALRQPPAALDPHIRAGKPTETRGVPFLPGYLSELSKLKSAWV